MKERKGQLQVLETSASDMTLELKVNGSTFSVYTFTVSFFFHSFSLAECYDAACILFWYLQNIMILCVILNVFSLEGLVHKINNLVY